MKGKSIKSDSNKIKNSWSQTVQQGDFRKEVTVEKLDNQGYLVTIYKSDIDKKGNYISSTKKLYSDINPLDTETDPLEEVFKIFNRKDNGV